MINRPSRPVVKARPSPSGLDGHSVQNEILLQLPTKESEILFPNLIFIELPIHTVANEAGEIIPYCYFVNSGLCSILNAMTDGKTVEVGLTGKEGFVGLPVVVGLKTSGSRVVAQVKAGAFRIPAGKMTEVLSKCPMLERSLNRYAQALAIQSTQVAACNRLHDVEERLARWLLMCQDRIGGGDIPLTQEFLGHMLGSRRASVTVAAGILQKAGLITYNRGNVHILNRANLEDAACECYEILSKQTRNWRTEA